MPVNVLLCEGASGSPDVRLIRAVLRGIGLEIVPLGGKDAFSGIVRGWRQQDACVCAIIDSDFPRKPEAWAISNNPAPPPWTVRHNDQDIVLGWRWKRKEIENYFIDPEVLTRALGWDEPRKRDYVTRLDGVFDSLSCVTAARMALTSCASPRNRLETQVELNAGVDEMKDVLRKRATKYNDGALLDEKTLLGAFTKYLPDCSPGGRFRQHALEVFAGKNVLARIQNTSGFAREIQNLPALKERVIEALEKDEAPHEWLPEWTALRSAVESWTPPDEPPITTVAPPE